MVAYYHKLFSGKDDTEKVFEECKQGKRGCVACKKELIQNIIKELTPIRERRKYYEEHMDLVDKILIEGTKKARKVAMETTTEIKKAMKLDYFDI